MRTELLLATLGLLLAAPLALAQNDTDINILPPDVQVTEEDGDAQESVAAGWNTTTVIILIVVAVIVVALIVALAGRERYGPPPP